MSMMIAPALPVVKSTLALLAVPTEAETALADRLAFVADGGDSDDYSPGWDAETFVPSLADEWEETGRSIGRDGSLPSVTDVFPDASKRDLIVGAFAFSEGLHDGFGAYAKEAGYDRGLAGDSCEQPESIPSRFALSFQIGWDRGNREFEERAAIMVAYHQQCDWEREYEIEMREIDAINREVFYGSAFASMVD